MKKIISLFLSVVLVLTMLPSLTVFAGQVNDGASTNGEGKCTQIYFGSGITDTGSTFYGRSEDYSSSSRKILEVKERKTHAPGEMFKTSDPEMNFEWPYPEKTLRYIYCKDSVHNESYYPEPYAEIGMNEKNVACSSSVTLSGCMEKIYNVDSWVEDGLKEVDTPSLVLMQAETAKEGIKLLAKIVDEKGASDPEGTMISDPNETWFFQILSGHQYVAYKLPGDKVGFTPNITANVGPNGYVDVTNTDNFIASADLIKVAQEAGTFVGDPSQDPNDATKIKIANSYSKDEKSDFWTGRLRVGYGYIYNLIDMTALKEKFPEQYQYLDFLVDPAKEKKYSLYDSMRMLAYRGEGTEWGIGNPTSNRSSIGNDATQECHVVEVRSNMPDEIATIEWLAMGPAEFSIYLPYYGNLTTDVYSKYNFFDQHSFNPGNLHENTFWHLARRTHTLAKGPGYQSSNVKRTAYGQGVKDFWEKYQKELIKQQPAVDKYISTVLAKEGRAKAEIVATEISKSIAEQTYEIYIKMVEELTAYTAQYPSTPPDDQEKYFVPSFMNDKDVMPVYEALTDDFTLNIKDADTGAVKDQSYTGKDVTPAVNVAMNGRTLEKDVDYTLKYSGNKNVGKATITITGKDYYKGSKTVTFKIIPKNASKIKVTAGKKQIKLKWKKASKITKYQVRYKLKSAKKWTVKTVSAKKKSYVIKKLKKGKKYQVQMRSYKTSAKVKYYSTWSKTKTVKVK